jgi:hypothetical protein
MEMNTTRHTEFLLKTVFSKGKSMKASFSAAAKLFGVGTVVTSLCGCAVQPTRPGVPSSAVQVASGDKVVAFTSPHDGKAYLNDDTDKCVVYSTDLKRDQVMRFEPDSDTVRIDGNTAPEGIANPRHDHSIYFLRSAQADRADLESNTSSNNTSAGSSGASTMPTIRVPIGVQVDVQSQQPAPK